MKHVLLALRCVTLGLAWPALGCDECESKCDDDYQECLSESSPEDCGQERARCESACQVEAAQDAQEWEQLEWN